MTDPLPPHQPAERQTLWCEHAVLPGGATAAGVVIDIAVDTIIAVGSAPRAPAGAVRLEGVTLAGFANTHSHAFHRALRGRTHGGAGNFWTWREQMYALAAGLDPDRYEALATATFAEMVAAGYTVVGEFHYLHRGPGGVPYADPNEMGRRLVRAAAAAGIRLTLLDTCYLSGGFGRDLDPVQRRFSDRSADAWSVRVDALRDVARAEVAVGAAIHSVRAVDPPSISTIAHVATEGGMPLHAHVSEQPTENDECLAAHRCSPVELLERHGALRAAFTAVHGTHVTADDAVRLGASGATCCICATTERDLADGVGPTTLLRDRGVALTIGSDSHAVIDPFEETRALELDARLTSGQRGNHGIAELLDAAGPAGYRSLGWPGGAIEPGRLADLVTVGLGGVRLAGADRRDLAPAVVFAAAPADVSDVFVGGRRVVTGGVHETIDVPHALASSIAGAWKGA